MTEKVIRKEEGQKAVGTTGTDTIAALYYGIEKGIVISLKILTPDGKIHLQNGVDITSKDVGKAIGTMRAGVLILLREAGMWTGEVKIAYMLGASELYVDAIKAQKIGMAVPGVAHLI